MTKFERYQQMFMKMAILSSEQSFAKRSKVGAVLVKDERVVVNSWNGRVSGQPNICENGDTTRFDVMHAEMNCIAFAAKYGINTDGCDIYLTLSPCPNCALLLIQSGIRAVYYIDEYRITDGIDLLKRSNIKVEQLEIK